MNLEYVGFIKHLLFFLDRKMGVLHRAMEKIESTIERVQTR